MRQPMDEPQEGQKFQPAVMKKQETPREEEPVYVKVNTQHRDEDDDLINDDYDHGEPINTDVASENEAMDEPFNNATQELPTIKTEINHEKIVPQFEDVKVKSKLDEKIVKKPEKKIGGLIELAESKEEFQTDVRKQDNLTDSQSDFDDLEFADVSSED